MTSVRAASPADPALGDVRRGADALAMTDVLGDQAEAGIGSEFLRVREPQLRRIGEEPKTTTALEARAVLYARLLFTCGECHQAIGVMFEDPA